MSNSILVIGNGFDLDLGLKTKYSDFAKSNCWPHVEFNKLPISKNGILDLGEEPHNICMKDYIETIRTMVLEENTWFDLEKELLNFAANIAVNNTFSTAKEDEIYFNNLQSRLQKFIEEAQKNSINTIKNECCAASILRANCFDMVYSFNYTDINYFSKLIGQYQEMHCQHLHGELSNSSIILGVDETPLPTGYEWLHKTSNRHYPHHDINNSLENANDIIFFGLSFGSIDFIYFERYLKELSTGRAIEETSKQNITIVTKDNQSQLAIKQRIREMDVELRRLFEQSHLNFIITDDKNDFAKLNEILFTLTNRMMMKKMGIK